MSKVRAEVKDDGQIDWSLTLRKGWPTGLTASWPTLIRRRAGVAACFYSLDPTAALDAQHQSEDWQLCGEAELWFFVGFLCSSTLCQNFTGFRQNSPEFHQNFARISNWSTLKKGIATTQPSHRQRRHSPDFQLPASRAFRLQSSPTPARPECLRNLGVSCFLNRQIHII